MNRRVFMKSGAMALATMGLNPSFLRRTVFAQDLLKGAALRGNARGKVLVVSVPARRGRRVERRRAARRARLLRDAPDDRHSAADIRRREHGDRPRRILRSAPVALAVQAALGRRHSRPGARGRLAEQLAVALRRAGLYGKRHARQQGHARRMAQSLPRRQRHVRRVQAARRHRDREGVAVPGRRDDAADAAHPRRRLADGSDEQHRRVHDSHQWHAGRAHRSALSHRHRRRRARRGRRDVRGDEDPQERRTRSSTSRRIRRTIRARRSASTSSRSRS